MNSLKSAPPPSRQDAGDVFPNEPLWMHFIKKAYIGEREFASGIFKSFLLARDGEALTGASSNNKVNCSTELSSINLSYVT